VLCDRTLLHAAACTLFSHGGQLKLKNVHEFFGSCFLVTEQRPLREREHHEQAQDNIGISISVDDLEYGSRFTLHRRGTGYRHACGEGQMKGSLIAIAG